RCRPRRASRASSARISSAPRPAGVGHPAGRGFSRHLIDGPSGVGYAVRRTRRSPRMSRLALAVALLATPAARGDDLDDEVSQHLPDFPDFGKRITVRHLLHHTSGLRDQWDLLQLAGWRLEDVITDDDVYRLVRRQRALNFDPGAEFAYCNTGYTVAA